MIDILILALFAVFILFRLFTVLGSRTGTEKDPFQEPSPPEKDSNLKKKAKRFFSKEAIIDVPFEQTEKGVKGGQRILESFKKKDSTFNVQEFLEGAQSAFETILKAFSNSDKKTLKSLLSSKVFSLFIKDIEAREEKHQTLQILIKDLNAEILNARLTSHTMEIDVQFESEQTHTTTSPNSSISKPPIVSQEVFMCIDLWTFEKPLNAQDPNWILIATEEGPPSS
ncbi:MAG: Tim44 domain-containing protein [Proteobacteria bacterium]|nr:Tim44 domain-containing protein [Pseudomonadota bacterium]